MKPLIVDENVELHREYLATTCRALYQQGWMPGTSGNLSVRSGEAVVITASGRSKRTMSRNDTVMVDPFEGLPLVGETEWPSAETSVHLAVYQYVPDCGAVIHAHTPYATAVATLRGAGQPWGEACFEELELAKGLGVTDPSRVVVPVFSNWADVPRIAADVRTYLGESGTSAPPALFIDRHGVTVWGHDLDQARDRLECIEELSRLTLLTTEHETRTTRKTAEAGP
ncbi:methylthioribulose 1-phosphate dehydratase [Streptomyces acidiscabies]|uniref:methylthioribulose 1-phosphate dehydratase n=1 Tax=Streptomyces acidiscabies TaxID=42234 RepID=UPI0009534677|nr:methylthioribulose 1-phosphate dehydratase [Streptomyces acidiscabies]